MELSEFRNSAIQRWMRGDDRELAERIRDNRLNSREREFVAQIVSGDAPKRQAGAKRTSLKPLRAGLIRFWLSEVDGWEKDNVYHAVEQTFGVSTSAVRKYFRQLDRPKTVGAAEMHFLLEFELSRRRAVIASGNAELIALMRDTDLKPNSRE